VSGVNVDLLVVIALQAIIIPLWAWNLITLVRITVAVGKIETSLEEHERRLDSLE
jgi:hypothetical protein